MSILVTGGAGFIGSHVCEALLRQGARVVILDDLNDFYDPVFKRANLERLRSMGSVIFYQADIRNRGAVAEVFAKEKPRMVIHLAARAGVRPSLADPVLYEEVNVIGTLHLLEAARNAGIQNFIFASSSSVYGINGKVPFAESDSIDFPVSPYATTKRAGELLCFNYSHLYALPVTCLRFFTVYGPRQRPEMAIYKFTRQILNGEPVKMFGDGTSSRDYTFIDDIVRGVLAAANKPQPFQIYNLGNSTPTTLRSLIDTIARYAGESAKIQQLPDQPGDVPTTFADVTLAGKELDYRPRVSMEVGIERFVSWYRDERLTVGQAA